MSKLKEARDHIYKLEFRIADLDFLLASAYDLLEKVSGNNNEQGALAQIWCMRYEDSLESTE